MLVYTPEEVAKLLKVNKRTVYKLIREGCLVAKRVGSQFRITSEQLAAYLERSGKS